MKKGLLVLVVILLFLIGCVKEPVELEDREGEKPTIPEMVEDVKGTKLPLEQEIDALLKEGSVLSSKYAELEASLTTITGLTNEDRERIKQKLVQLSKIIKYDGPMQRDDVPYIGMWNIHSDCQDIDAKFSYFPIAIEDIEYIGPVGALTEPIAGHVVPNDHAAVSYNKEVVDVIMPADGFLTTAERHEYTPPPGKPKVNHYHLYFEISCSLYIGLVHVSTIDPEILEMSEELKNLDEKDMSQIESAWIRIPIKAGQKIGTATQWGMLGILAVDTRFNNTGYANPESYKNSQPWRLHGVNAFDYFEEPLKTQVFSKITRTAEPRGGKAGYDIPGKLIGSWFMQGTNGMLGTPPEDALCGNMVCSYWYGHFSIVPDVMEPSEIRVQFGYDLSELLRGPYGIKGNSPNPADISVEDGLVKYELVKLEYVPDKPGFTENTDIVVATMLIEMIDDMTVKIEPFVGKTASEVDGFTDNAKIYVR